MKNPTRWNPKPSLGHSIHRTWWIISRWSVKFFLIDKRTRYPVDESVPSADCLTKKDERGMLATYGTPSRIESGIKHGSILKNSRKLQSRNEFSTTG